MVSEQTVLVAGGSLVLNEAIQYRLQRGPPGDRYQTILSSDSSAIPTREAVELVIVVPRDWRDLSAWLPPLRQHAGSVPWLVIADLPLAGAFFPLHEPHLCGLLPHQATAEELQATVAALLDAHPLFRPLDLLRLLLDHAPRPAPGRQILTPTPAEFQCGCGIALELTNRQIATIMNDSLSTVKSHVSALLHKLGYRKREQVRDLFNQALAYPSPPSTTKNHGRPS